MTNLVDRLPLPPRADVAAGQRPAGAAIVGASLEYRSGGSLSRGYGRGLTLIEMLVALAVTLVMMAAVVNLFANMSASIRNRRAAIETGSQLRQVRNRLAMDLSGATCRGSTWQDPAENQGYIEIIEGEWSDKNPSSQILPANVNTTNGIDTTISLIPASQAFDSETGAVPGGLNIGAGAVTDGRALGDWDDILALTVRSESDPFTGRFNNALVESPLAEVLWFATEQPPSTPADPNDGMRRIYRRVLLIAPWLGVVGTDIDDPPNNISAHWEQTGATITAGRWVANTLGDVTKRENRATRNPRDKFPHPLIRTAAKLLPGNTSTDALVLSSALAFDVRLFDPTAPLIDNVGTVVGPSDAGFDAAKWVSATTVGQGDYVDLNYRASYAKFVSDFSTGYGGMPAANYSTLSEFPQLKSQLQTPLGGVYDTWSYHYENDGMDQDDTTGNDNIDDNDVTTGLIDEGANGLDDDNANGVDDRGERETSPPYDVPLRGVKVILRVYEPDSRQIRESSVTHSFKQ